MHKSRLFELDYRRQPSNTSTPEIYYLMNSFKYALTIHVYCISYKRSFINQPQTTQLPITLNYDMYHRNSKLVQSNLFFLLVFY